MIKVIKPRSRRNIECMNCGALLSYEKEDVKKAASKKFNETAFEFVNDYHDHIICPEYGEEIRLGGYTLMDKDEIIELAKISGCDLDGDVVLIGDKTYYVHIFKNIVEEM